MVDDHNGVPRRILLSVLAVSAVLAVGPAAVLCAESLAATRPPTSSSTSRLTIGRSSTARALPSGFTGLSFEFKGLEQYLGSDPSAIDPVFGQLIRNLAPAQRPVVRIGGDSTDWAWWPVPHTIKPGGVHYILGPRWAQVARALARSLSARLILGINFEADSPRVAAYEAHSLISGIGAGSVTALELGNEPELYGGFAWYRTSSGQRVYGRPRGYDFQHYLTDYFHIASALPRVPLAGPGSGSPAYLAGLGTYLAREPRVRMVTVHAYPLKHCTHSEIPTISQLLAPSTSSTLTSQVGGYAAVAHHHGRSLRVDEINSVSCGGYRAVTGSFAAALWALGQLFQLDRVGVDGVNFHTIPDTTQHLIVTRQSHGKWTGAVLPEYYGLMAFAQAAPGGSRLLNVSGPSTGPIQTYATLATNGQIHVVVINTSARARSFAVRIPAGARPASLALLRAPSLGAQGEVTLGGQSINPVTGSLAGHSTASMLTPVGGAYAVRVPAASAALLTVP